MIGNFFYEMYILVTPGDEIEYTFQNYSLAGTIYNLHPSIRLSKLNQNPYVTGGMDPSGGMD